MASEVALSIILPVHNAQSALAEQVGRILEAAPEVTSRFEVLVVDDGSTDHTGEIAHDLAIIYPQVRVVRHAERRGSAAAIRTGVAQARGEIAFVYEGRSPLKASHLPRLWESEESAARDSASEVIEAELVETPRLSAWRSRIRALRDHGRSGPPASKITPRRRSSVFRSAKD